MLVVLVTSYSLKQLTHDPESRKVPSAKSYKIAKTIFLIEMVSMETRLLSFDIEKDGKWRAQ